MKTIYIKLLLILFILLAIILLYQPTKEKDSLYKGKENEDVYFQVGGGMTWGSNPSDEYQETLDKAASIMKALRGYYEE